VIGRAFAGPVLKRLSPAGVLLSSAILAALGLYLIANTSGNTIFLGAIVFGAGVCYFWPTMLGFVAEYLPKTGAVGLNLMGGAGMFAVSLYTMFMGKHYDELLLSKLPTGSDLKTFMNTTDATMQGQLNAAKIAAGPEVLNLTLWLPIILVITFGGLYFYMRNKPKGNLSH
jgi:hypothetical protein